MNNMTIVTNIQKVESQADVDFSPAVAAKSTPAKRVGQLTPNANSQVRRISAISSTMLDEGLKWALLIGCLIAFIGILAANPIVILVGVVIAFAALIILIDRSTKEDYTDSNSTWNNQTPVQSLQQLYDLLGNG